MSEPNFILVEDAVVEKRAECAKCGAYNLLVPFPSKEEPKIWLQPEHWCDQFITDYMSNSLDDLNAFALQDLYAGQVNRTLKIQPRV